MEQFYLGKMNFKVIQFPFFGKRSAGSGSIGEVCVFQIHQSKPNENTFVQEEGIRVFENWQYNGFLKNVTVFLRL